MNPQPFLGVLSWKEKDFLYTPSSSQRARRTFLCTCFWVWLSCQMRFGFNGVIWGHNENKGAQGYGRIGHIPRVTKKLGARCSTCFFTPPCLVMYMVVVRGLQAKESLGGLFMKNREHSFLQKEKKNISPSVLETKGFSNLSWLISALHPVGGRRPVPYQHFARSRL